MDFKNIWKAPKETIIGLIMAVAGYLGDSLAGLIAAPDQFSWKRLGIAAFVAVLFALKGKSNDSKS